MSRPRRPRRRATDAHENHPPGHERVIAHLLELHQEHFLKRYPSLRNTRVGGDWARTNMNKHLNPEEKCLKLMSVLYTAMPHLPPIEQVEAARHIRQLATALSKFENTHMRRKH